ncbi:MAG: DsbA family oxidoreductase [Hyphomicrobiaceae bacterium]|nr:DsbA family oxidoreductase [Hyphomicrobiaceae bacterium]
MIEIDVVSDFICPWCHIGVARLGRILDTMDPALYRLRFLPFELNPGMPAEGVERRRYRIWKFGSWEISQHLDRQTLAAAQPDGIVIHYERIERTPNTRLAHRLSRAAWAEGCQRALVEGLFSAYFVDGRDIGAREALRDIALASGMTAAAVDAVLDGQGEAESTADDLLKVAETGLDGVPFYIIGGRSHSGALPVERLRSLLTAAVS